MSDRIGLSVVTWRNGRGASRRDTGEDWRVFDKSRAKQDVRDDATYLAVHKVAGEHPAWWRRLGVDITRSLVACCGPTAHSFSCEDEA